MIEQLQTKLKESKTAKQVCLFARTAIRTGSVIAPAVTAGYLVATSDDRVVLTIAMGLAIYSLTRIVNSAYLAEANKKRGRK